MPRKPVNEEFKIFSENLKTLLKENNLKQRELAEYLHVKRQTVSLYTTGQSTPDALLLKKIAIFFNVSADWLLGLTDIKNDVKSTSVKIKDICKYTEVKEVAVALLNDLVATQKAFIFEFLDKFLDKEVLVPLQKESAAASVPTETTAK